MDINTYFQSMQRLQETLAKSRQEPMPGLIADTELEASWAPVNELDGLSGT